MLTMLNLASAVFALLAAGLWLWSTTVKLPGKFSSPYGAPPPELMDMYRALSDQSQRSAWGATAAALAALCQVIAILAA